MNGNRIRVNDPSLPLHIDGQYGVILEEYPPDEWSDDGSYCHQPSAQFYLVRLDSSVIVGLKPEQMLSA